MKRTLASWEPQARSIVRIVLAFLVSLHAFRLAFGLFPQMAGRRGAPGMPLDLLPQIIAYAAIVAGVLVLAGLFTRPAALLLSLQSLAAYIFIAAPRALEPIRAGANEIILYFLFFLFIALDGPGSWSLDHKRAPKR